jgi:hypothetical protein
VIASKKIIDASYLDIAAVQYSSDEGSSLSAPVAVPPSLACPEELQSWVRRTIEGKNLLKRAMRGWKHLATAVWFMILMLINRFGLGQS